MFYHFLSGLELDSRCWLPEHSWKKSYLSSLHSDLYLAWLGSTMERDDHKGWIP